MYRPKKPLKLFNILNDQNLQFIVDKLDEEPDKVLFDNLKCSDIKEQICVKYGIKINKYEQAYEINKYNDWGDNC